MPADYSASGELRIVLFTFLRIELICLYFVAQVRDNFEGNFQSDVRPVHHLAG